MQQNSRRAGVTMNTVRGYSAFVPAELPPNPPLEIDYDGTALIIKKKGEIVGLYNMESIICAAVCAK